MDLKHLVVVLLVLSSIGGCRYKQVRDPRVLVIALQNEPETLNPITSVSAYAASVNTYIYESLIKLDYDTLKPRPLLAHHWEISSDNLSYTFYLRRGVKWHDGVSFTASDVVYTYEKIQDPSVDAGRWRAFLKLISKVEAVDNYTVKFTLSRPYFGGLVMCGSLRIIPKHAFSKGDFNTSHLNRAPIGTGPFKFGYWKTGRQIYLERNEDYWGEKPAFIGVSFRIITDSAVMFQEMKKGSVDVIDLTEIQWVKQTSSRAFREVAYKFRYFPPRATFRFIAWNLRSKLFSDVKVRRAMANLIDVKSITEKLSFGLYKQVTGPFYIHGSNYDRDVRPFKYDPKLAVALLKSAGWEDRDGDSILDKDGEPFVFNLIYTAGVREFDALYSIIRENLKRVGIVVKSRKVDWGLLSKFLSARNFDAVLLGVYGSIFDDAYTLWHSSGAESGMNVTGYHNELVDDLLERSRVTFDDGERAVINRQIHRLIYGDQPCLFLYARPELVAVSKRFDNVVLHKVGLNSMEWKVRR